MTDIVEFLTARFDEREARARDASSGEWRFDLGTYDIESGDIEDARDVCYLYGRNSDWDTGQGVANGRFIAENSPRYVLADIAAKRWIGELRTLRRGR